MATPIDFTATLSYVNFLNHSDQARATAVSTVYCLLPVVYCLMQYFLVWRLFPTVYFYCVL